MTLLDQEPTIINDFTLPFGGGFAQIDPVTGAPDQFIDPAHDQREFLLNREVDWHSFEHQWGSGHIISSRGATRWNVPTALEIDASAVTATFALAHELELRVHRTANRTMTESYRFINKGNTAVQLNSIGIQTPFADLYEDAENALGRSVHAHLFTGGSWAWALAQPMSGIGRSLGLILRKGALWGYSIETRNLNTKSNARGHIVLQVTDQARNPRAFGGQPSISVEPGESYEVAWELGWYESVEQFLDHTDAPALLERVSSPIDESIRITTDAIVTSSSPALTIVRDGADTLVTSDRMGTFPIDFNGTARTEIGFHADLETTVRRRVAYILDRQRTPERPGSLSYAIVPVDTSTGLTQSTNGWSDWTDGSERIGMAVLLQQALSRGWATPDVETALAGWSRFAQEHLLDESASPRRGSQDHHTGARLYDSPWLAQFFLERFRHTGSADDLQLSARILERAFELGADRFLAIQFSETCTAVASALEGAGYKTHAVSLRDQLVASADHFLSQGDNLPPHEVAYEQSMVAPLLNLFIDGYELTGEERFLDAIRSRLPWLLAFGGEQPHTRLRGVAIRHWDGFWFGLRRQWGDTFPHYWSALTATVLYRLPASVRSVRTDELALAILRANMSNYFADGSATCAFVFPTTVDGAAAHEPDPLANDQDWHLAIWLDLVQTKGVPSA